MVKHQIPVIQRDHWVKANFIAHLSLSLTLTTNEPGEWPDSVSEEDKVEGGMWNLSARK